MPDISENNKRIAKNTLLLYVRMIFTMLIGLYTSRVVLKTLGATDFGIYEVVGGVVSLFSFLNGTMAAATQRFLTFEIGRDDRERLSKMFSVSLTIHIILCISIIVLAETIGLWFLNYKLNIPPERIGAANWVYQFSILACVFSITQTPYNALIIAREKMNVFAYVSIYGAVVKLLLVIFLSYLSADKLIWYAIFLLIKNVSEMMITRIYCLYNYEESKFHFIRDISLYKEIGSFAGWNLSTHFVYMAKSQGVAMLLNVFFGPIANAARGIASQVQGVLIQLVDNFQMATVPQITKNYAAGDVQGMNTLITRSSKLSVVLLSIIVPPFVIEADTILQLWLGEVPQYAVLFTRMSLIATLINCFSGLIGYGALATGNVKRYQLVISSVISMQFILTFVFYELGMSSSSMYSAEIIVSFAALFTRLYLLKSLIDFPVLYYIINVVGRSALSILLACIIPAYLYVSIPSSYFRLIVIFLISGICSTISGAYIVFNRNERIAVRNMIKAKLKIEEK